MHNSKIWYMKALIFDAMNLIFPYCALLVYRIMDRVVYPFLGRYASDAMQLKKPKVITLFTFQIPLTIFPCFCLLVLGALALSFWTLSMGNYVFIICIIFHFIIVGGRYMCNRCQWVILILFSYILRNIFLFSYLYSIAWSNTAS